MKMAFNTCVSQTLLLLGWLAGFSQAFYGGNSAVVSLTEKNFKKEVMDSDEIWLVEFYAPWCGHCQVRACLSASGAANAGRS